MDEFELVTLKSGIKSLRSLGNLETFHPVTGPRIEATVLHVEQQRIVARAQAEDGFVIWDVGLGAAANALAAIEALLSSGARAEIHSFDRTTAPLEFALANAEELGYLLPHADALHALIRDHEVALSPRLRWKLHLGDFGSVLRQPHPLPSPHSIFYDPYSPLGNPDMWSLEHFRLLRTRVGEHTDCLLTNYTRSTAVRVTLLLAGFYVGLGCAVGEKNETTLAANKPGLLERPLGMKWLEWLKTSGNSAPLNGTRCPQAALSPADYELVRNLPQFRLAIQ